MRKMMYIALTVSFFSLVGCNGNGSANGGGSENSSQGTVKVKMPF